MKSRTKQINSFSVQGLNNTHSNGSAYPSISSAYWQPAPNPTPYLVPGNLNYGFIKNFKQKIHTRQYLYLFNLDYLYVVYEIIQ